jgi:hypothetical protein
LYALNRYDILSNEHNSLRIVEGMIKKENLMKRSLVFLALTLVINSSVFAKNTLDYYNPIAISNFAPYDIMYQFGQNLSRFYLVKKGETDVYSAGVFDTHVLITITACVERRPDGFCTTTTSHMNPIYYNAKLIKAIQIKSVFDYKVICLDNGTTSCVVQK